MKYSTNTVKATISLFKVFPINSLNETDKQVSLEECLRNGILPLGNYNNILDSIPEFLFKAMKDEYGVDIWSFNQTLFKKSYHELMDMTDEEYFFHQILHYFTTYGAAAIGVNVPTYFPEGIIELTDEELQPKKFTIIRGVDDDKIVELINDFAKNTTAPSPRIKDSFLSLAQFLSIDIEEIKSFELQVIAYTIFNTVPKDPVTALRYLNYRIIDTHPTILIKNKEMFDAIRNSYEDISIVRKVFDNLPLSKWAEIFFRYKPIFLAYKHGYPQIAPTINKIRKLADTYHKPLSDINFQNITKLVSEGRMAEAETLLKKANNRQLIKVINSIRAIVNNTSRVYNIRNGKIFVDDSHHEIEVDDLHEVFIFATILLGRSLQKKLKGKTIVIPDYIDYSLPVTEKQFIGNYPYGTCISCPHEEAFTLGIQWFNHEGIRTDLDFHLNSVTEHFGWNGNRKNNSVIYTGDMTDAPLPNGAAEGYWIYPNGKTYVTSISLFTGSPNSEFKFAISAQKPTSDDYRRFTFKDPIFTPIPMTFNDSPSRTMNLGILMDRKFYLYGGTISAAGAKVPSDHYASFIEGVSNQLKTKITFKEIFKLLGISTYDIRPTDIPDEDIIDLTPEALTARTFFDIID